MRSKCGDKGVGWRYVWGIHPFSHHLKAGEVFLQGFQLAAVAAKTAVGSEEVKRTMETIRFADPMEHPAVAAIAEKIKAAVAELGAAADAGEAEKVTELCRKIESLAKERADKLMMLK
ncbi:MAG: hypothetical protein E7057_10030 [Lentisphaerae bacterium]|nr:hypothetical protein [Lentisphaerota bacterium]